MDNLKYYYLNLAYTTDNPEILEILSEIDLRGLKIRVAKNRNTSNETLNKLSKDKSIYVRGAVASNPNTPEDILRRLSNSKARYVNYFLFENPSTPSDLMPKLIYFLYPLKDVFISSANK